MGVFSNMLRGFSRDFGDQAALDSQREELFAQKAKLLAQMRQEAAANGKKPSLEQYRLIADRFAKSDEGREAVAAGVWNEKIAADLSGQDLSGIVFSEPKKIYDIENQTTQVQSDYDSFNRDGDGQINVAACNDFYDNVRLKGSKLRDAIIDPATSFGPEIGNGADLDGLTFNDMKRGDLFVFGAGNYTNIKMTNVNDGEIVFGENSRVEKLSIQGRTAALTLGLNAMVDGLTMNDGFRILELEMGKNSLLANADLTQSTISMSSQFEPGATLQNVRLSSNLSGLDFSGVRLNNVFIDGKAIQSTKDLEDAGIGFDKGTMISLSDSIRQQSLLLQVQDVGVALRNAMSGMGGVAQAAAASAVEQQVVVAAAPEAPANSFAGLRIPGIQFGGDVAPGEATPGLAVAQMERTVPLDQQASGANMDRGDGGPNLA